MARGDRVRKWMGQGQSVKRQSGSYPGRPNVRAQKRANQLVSRGMGRRDAMNRAWGEVRSGRI